MQISAGDNPGNYTPNFRYKDGGGVAKTELWFGYDRSVSLSFISCTCVPFLPLLMTAIFENVRVLPIYCYLFLLHPAVLPSCRLSFLRTHQFLRLFWWRLEKKCFLEHFQNKLQFRVNDSVVTRILITRNTLITAIIASNEFNILRESLHELNYLENYCQSKASTNKKDQKRLRLLKYK